MFVSAADAGTALPGQRLLAAAEPDRDPLLQEAVVRLEYLTPMNRAFILDKGKAGVMKLPADKLREIGLVPETWSLEVIPTLRATVSSSSRSSPKSNRPL